MNATWMLCLVGTAALSALMAANGTWRRHPALFVYLLILTVQSLALWALWASHWYSVVYYGLGAAAQLTELWIMVELALQVTAASPAVERFIRKAIPTFALLTLLWASVGAMNLPGETTRFLRVASHLDTAVSLSWAATFIVLIVLIVGSGCQFSQGARGIASGFLLEILSSNIAAFLYVHAPNVACINVGKSISYGATLVIWTASLAGPFRALNIARLQVIPLSETLALKKGTPGQ